MKKVKAWAVINNKAIVSHGLYPWNTYVYRKRKHAIAHKIFDFEKVVPCTITYNTSPKRRA
jgi:uracil-DNA glycosylase